MVITFTSRLMQTKRLKQFWVAKVIVTVVTLVLLRLE
jgi:hypothetical protein